MVDFIKKSTTKRVFQRVKKSDKSDIFDEHREVFREMQFHKKLGVFEACKKVRKDFFDTLQCAGTA